MWYEDKVLSMKCVMSGVQGEKVCGTKIVGSVVQKRRLHNVRSGVRRKCTLSERLHLQ